MSDPAAQYSDLLADISKLKKLDINLIKGICAVESSWDKYRVRFEPGQISFDKPDYYAKLNGISLDTEVNLQHTSFGLMQIMGTTARWLGYSGPLTKLIEPQTGLFWGCTYLSKLVSRYQKLEDVISSYNHGSPYKDAQGAYVNQKYIDAVKKNMGLVDDSKLNTIGDIHKMKFIDDWRDLAPQNNPLLKLIPNEQK